MLGVALIERAEMRAVTCTALRYLVRSAFDSNPDVSTDTAPMRALVAQYANNFLPILFNIYVGNAVAASDDRIVSERLTNRAPYIVQTLLKILETIRLYLSVTPPSIINVLFSRTLAKLNDGE
jgi:hypothetical protein